MAVSRVKTSSVLQGFPKYRSMLGGNSAYIPDYSATWLIGTVTAAGGESSLSFTSIPQTYSSLQIRGIARNSTNNYYTTFKVRLNSDSASNYNIHYLAGLGTGTEAYGAGDNGIQVYGSTGVPSLSNNFGVSIIDFHNYTSTTQNKTVRALGGSENNSSGQSAIVLQSGLWRNTAAVTSISLVPSGTWTAGTTFALYGMK